MFCPKCGKELNNEDAVFCTGCGLKLDVPSTPESLTDKDVLSAEQKENEMMQSQYSQQGLLAENRPAFQQDHPQAEMVGLQADNPVQQIPNQGLSAAQYAEYPQQAMPYQAKKKNRLLLIVILAVVLVAVGTLIFLVISNAGGAGQQRDNLSAYAAGLSEREILGEDIFYIDSKRNIVRKNVKSNEARQIFNEKTVMSMFLYDKKMYFTVSEEDANDEQILNLYKMDLSGTNIEKVSQEPIYWFVVYKNKIYYKNANVDAYGKQKKEDENYFLKRMDLDGQNQEVILDSFCYRAVLAEDRIYYISAVDGNPENNAVYSTDLNGGNGEYLLRLGNDSSSDFCYYNGSIIYYIADGEILSYSIKDEVHTTLVSADSDSFTVQDHYLVYFTKNKDEARTLNMNQWDLREGKNEVLAEAYSNWGLSVQFRITDQIYVASYQFIDLDANRDIPVKNRILQNIESYGYVRDFLAVEDSYVFYRSDRANDLALYKVDLRTADVKRVFEEDEDVYRNRYAFYDGVIYHMQIDKVGSNVTYTIQEMDLTGKPGKKIYSQNAGIGTSPSFCIAEPGGFADEAVFVFTFQTEEEVHGVALVTFSGEMLGTWGLGEIELNDISAQDRMFYGSYSGDVLGEKRRIVLSVDTETNNSYVLFDREDNDNNQIFSYGNMNRPDNDAPSFYFKDKKGIGYTEDGENITSRIFESDSVGSAFYGTEKIYFTDSKTRYLYEIDYTGENLRQLKETAVEIELLTDELLVYFDVYENFYYTVELATGEIKPAFGFAADEN